MPCDRCGREENLVTVFGTGIQGTYCPKCRKEVLLFNLDKIGKSPGKFLLFIFFIIILMYFIKPVEQPKPVAKSTPPTDKKVSNELVAPPSPSKEEAKMPEKKEEVSSVNTQTLEIAINTNDQVVIDAFLFRANSGDVNAQEAMKTANPRRFISLAKRGKYDIDAQALQFLKIMEGFGNKYAHEAIQECGNRK